jgi:hypothetical protein
MLLILIVHLLYFSFLLFSHSTSQTTIECVLKNYNSPPTTTTTTTWCCRMRNVKHEWIKIATKWEWIDGGVDVLWVIKGSLWDELVSYSILGDKKLFTSFSRISFLLYQASLTNFVVVLISSSHLQRLILSTTVDDVVQEISARRRKLSSLLQKKNE